MTTPIGGAPKIHGQLQKLGFVVSERSVARYLQRIRRRGDAGKRWLALLQNHREAMVAFDFFGSDGQLSIQLLYCFFVIEHTRRKILHSMSCGTHRRTGLSNNYVTLFRKPAPIVM